MNNKYKINWVANKKINKRKIDDHLKNSEMTNVYTNGGPLSKLLEDTTRYYLNIDNSKAIIVTNNGTSALHALVSGINTYNKKKLRYATQSFTFPPSIEGSLQNSIIMDIDDELGLDLELFNNTNINDIDGIVVTNIFGNVVNINKYTEWAKKHDKILLFDNAATSYTEYKNSNCNNYGNGSIISFHHTKPIGFGEGGAIIVDKIYENEIRRCINFGIDNTQNSINSHDTNYLREGSNYKISEISCAYVLQYLDSFPIIKNIHQDLYKIFEHEINNMTGVKVLPNHSIDTPFVSCLGVLFDNKKHACENHFLSKGIYCRKYYRPLKNTKNAKYIYDHIVCFPCNIDMKNNDVYYITHCIRDLIDSQKIIKMRNSIEDLRNIRESSKSKELKLNNDKKELILLSPDEANQIVIQYPDFYFTPQYGKALEISDNGEWEISIWKINGETKIIYPYIKRKTILDGVVYYDLVSPYSYSGIYFERDVTSADLEEFLNAFHKCVKDKNYVAEYYKFSPFFGNNVIKIYQTLHIDNLSIYKNKTTIGVYIQNGYDEYWRLSKKGHRRSVSKAFKLGYKNFIKPLEITDIDKNSYFYHTYTETMNRVNANPYYKFDESYFIMLANELKGNIYLIYVVDGNNCCVASSIYIHWGNIFHYHLGGSDVNHINNGINNMLHDMAIKWACDNGLELVHLGGGLHDEDPLFNFKRSIGTLLLDFYHGKYIINNDVYNKLVQKRANELKISEKELLTRNYFPAYRS